MDFFYNVLRNKCPYDAYYSVVVINCENVKSSYSSNSDNYEQKIVTPSRLSKHLDSLISQKSDVLSDDEIIEIYKQLHESYANASNAVKKSHIQMTKNISSQMRK